MGHRDLENLFIIYEEIKRLNKKHEWKYNFKVDSGDFETRVDIDTDGEWKRGDGKLPSNGFEIYCPDLIDFNNQVIIEYEEEAKPNTGFFRGKLNKGHFRELLTPRDELRDWYYTQAKFAFLKMWETDFQDGKWKAILYQFLNMVRDTNKRGIIQQ